MTVLMCWCVDVDVLMCWCVDVLMIVLMCWCVDVLMCWCVVLMCWCVDDIALMCWCLDVRCKNLRNYAHVYTANIASYVPSSTMPDLNSVFPRYALHSALLPRPGFPQINKTISESCEHKNKSILKVIPHSMNSVFRSLKHKFSTKQWNQVMYWCWRLCWWLCWWQCWCVDVLMRWCVDV